MAGAVVSLFLDVAHPKKSGLCPVKIRVYFRGKTKFYAARPIPNLPSLDLSKDDFSKVHSIRPPHNFKALNAQLRELVTKAETIIERMAHFTFPLFEKSFLGVDTGKEFVLTHYNKYIAKLKAAGRLGTKRNYEQSLESISEYIKSKKGKPEKMTFYDITPDLLQGYEKWMLGKGNKPTTVGIYLRPLRAIFNGAIDAGVIDRSLYPFGKRSYQIPASRKVKKALSPEELKKLYFADPKSPDRERARAFWFFSYLSNGLNIADILELRFEDVQGETIVFTRQKIKNTAKGNAKPIVAVLGDYTKGVIAKYGNKPKKGDYIFPVYDKSMSDAERFNAKDKFTKYINQHIKLLAKSCGVTTAISSNWARHSFTTMAIREGASMEFIQDSLGHNNITTTMNYWAGFEESAKRGINEKLLSFTKDKTTPGP